MMTSLIHMIPISHPMLAFGLPAGGEWIVLLVLGLLIFGRRLPEVGKSLGRGIVEFKKGIKGLEDEIEEESSKPAPKRIAEDAPRELPKTRSRQDREEVAAREADDNPYAAVEERRRDD
jgi:sec-independent protein translocase protein TatA